MSAKIETLRPDHSAITGYVDELREDRVWGWAWDRRSPSLRVEIQVWIGDNPVATALADRARPDLKANGVGDGQHAFEIALPEATAETVSLPIRIVAKAPSGELIALERRPSSPAALPDSANQPIDAALRRIFDELEHVRTAQRVLGKAAHATLGDLRKLSSVEPRPPARPEPSGEAGTAERLAAIEAVLMRVDASLADLAHKVETAAKPGESGRIPAWLYAAIAAAAAVLATAFVMLGLTR